jgi:hypothetical protein
LPRSEINGGEEAPARSSADATSRDGDGQMRLACAGSADQDDVALLGDEAAAGQIAYESLVDRVSLKRKSSTSLANGSFHPLTAGGHCGVKTTQWTAQRSNGGRSPRYR